MSAGPITNRIEATQKPLPAHHRGEMATERDFPYRHSRMHLLARVSFATILFSIFFPMILRWWGASQIATVLELPFRLVCHRLPERVIIFFGEPMPLCSRCAGIWIGLSISAILALPSFSVRTLRWVLPLALGAMVIQIVLQDSGVISLSHPLRFSMGLLLSVPFGGTLGSLVKRELRDGIPAVD